MLRFFYTFLFYCSLPGVFLRFLWRSRHDAAYRRRWQERLGYFSLPLEIKAKKPIWIHTVSVGEFLAAVPLIKTLLAKYPDIPLLVTTTTITGSTVVKKNLGKQVFHAYCPFDLPVCVNRFINGISPRLLLLLETELWPNLLYLLKEKKIPVMLINARLSERSKKGYQRFKILTKNMLESLHCIACQDQEHKKRFLALAPRASVKMTGSLKFEMSIPTDLATKADFYRQKWGRSGFIWVAASTHAGEEGQVLAVHQQLLQEHPDALLILVPRHPERFESVGQVISKTGLPWRLRTQAENLSRECSVVLGNTMGELLLFYAIADVAFVGGSLRPIGGHNPLEPAALGKPVVVGPYTFNFATITEDLIQCGGAQRVDDEQALYGSIKELCLSLPKRQAMGASGQHFFEKNQGALPALLELIEEAATWTPELLC